MTDEDDLFRVLGEPRRREIVRLVAGDELSAGEIAARFDVTRTTISQHLTVLKIAGLVQERRDGTRRLYRTRPEGLQALKAFLDDTWAQALHQAGEAVEQSRSGGRRGRKAAG